MPFLSVPYRGIRVIVFSGETNCVLGHYRAISCYVRPINFYNKLFCVRDVHSARKSNATINYDRQYKTVPPAMTSLRCDDRKNSRTILARMHFEPINYRLVTQVHRTTLSINARSASPHPSVPSRYAKVFASHP